VLYYNQEREVNKMLEQVKEFFDREYKETKELLERKPSWCKPREVVFNSIQRCLRVAQFVQHVGVEYEDLSCYEEVREKLESLLKEV